MRDTRKFRLLLVCAVSSACLTGGAAYYVYEDAVALAQNSQRIFDESDQAEDTPRSNGMTMTSRELEELAVKIHRDAGDEFCYSEYLKYACILSGAFIFYLLASRFITAAKEP